MFPDGNRGWFLHTAPEMGVINTADNCLRKLQDNQKFMCFLFKWNRNVNKSLYSKAKCSSGEKAQQLWALFFRRAQALFPAPTWWLSTICSSSSRGSYALFWLPHPEHRWCTDICADTLLWLAQAPVHTYTSINKAHPLKTLTEDVYGKKVEWPKCSITGNFR